MIIRSVVLSLSLSHSLIDSQGNRATVPARCGQTLLDAAVMHKVDIEHPCEGEAEEEREGEGGEGVNLGASIIN